MRNGMITNSRGDKFWYQDDQLHRTDGPAIEYAGGDKMWYQNDLLHRTNGPALEYTSGAKYWWFKGYEYTFIDWLEHVDTYTEVEKTMMRLRYA
jgi:hypothetical protein